MIGLTKRYILTTGFPYFPFHKYSKTNVYKQLRLCKQTTWKKDFKKDKHEITFQKRSIQNHYKENVISVIPLNENGFVIVTLNVHSKLPHAGVKHWNSPKKYYITINHANCITLQNKHIPLFSQKTCRVYTNRRRTVCSIWRLDFEWNLALKPFIKSEGFVSQLLLNWFIFLKRNLYFYKLQRLDLYIFFYLKPMPSATCMWQSKPLINIWLRRNILKWHTWSTSV